MAVMSATFCCLYVPKANSAGLLFGVRKAMGCVCLAVPRRARRNYHWRVLEIADWDHLRVVVGNLTILFTRHLVVEFHTTLL